MIQRWVDIVVDGGSAPYAVTRMLRYRDASTREFVASSAKLENSHLPDVLIPDVPDGIVHAPAGPVQCLADHIEAFQHWFPFNWR